MTKFFAQGLWFVQGLAHPFFHARDAKFYCEDHGLDYNRAVEKFDSKKEYERWVALRKLEENGKITSLQRQVEFEIIPAYIESTNTFKEVNIWIADNTKEFPSKVKAAKWLRENKIPRKNNLRMETRTVMKTKQKVIEKAAVYTADFTYYDDQGKLVVEDVKSAYTAKLPDYVLRRKLMLFIHGIKINEI